MMPDGCRRTVAFAWRVDTGLGPADVLRVFRNRDRLVGLIGRWAGGGAVVAFDPVCRTSDISALTKPFHGDAPPIGEDARPGGADRRSGVRDHVGVTENVMRPVVGATWLGVLGYQLGHSLERLPEAPPRLHPRPPVDLAYYDHVLRFDRDANAWWFEGACNARDLKQARQKCEEIQEALVVAEADLAPRPFVLGSFQPTPTLEGHAKAVAAALDHIVAGDIFQANICMRLDASFEGDPLDAFLAGVEGLSPAYAAFIRSDHGAIVSLSPELFLRRTGRHVLTAPIKGTAPLDVDPDTLRDSSKDRSENTMIVDLMRNDLARVSVPGSITVPSALSVQRHTGVWHLVSEVEARLRPGVSDCELIQATFPPGSITGAPKVRAMEVINNIETTAREAYTGAIGWSGAHGLEMNVAIRTFEFADDGVWLGVGGGVVANSRPDAEVNECLVKAQPLIHALGGRLDPARFTRPAPRAVTEETDSAIFCGDLCVVTDEIVVVSSAAEPTSSTTRDVATILRRHAVPVAQRPPTHAELAKARETFAIDPQLHTSATSARDDRVARPRPGPLEGWLMSNRQEVSTSRAHRLRSRQSVLLIDNYDSFVHNLADYCQVAGAEVSVIRNDASDVRAVLGQIAEGRYDRVIISPGPGEPTSAGVSVDLIRHLPDHVPLLGVCLGHQAIAVAYGGLVVRAPEPVHGSRVIVHHDGGGIFRGLSAPVVGARYHSLMVDETSLVATPLRISARSPSGLVMGVRHRNRPVEGVQFHPESILTRFGHDLINRFLAGD